MTIFVLAPVFEEIKDWENFAIRVFLEMTENSDISPISNLFRKIGSVKDKLRFKEGVIFACG